eukprot:6181659-Pleurochrysis_carterae.AAC.2
MKCGPRVPRTIADMRADPHSCTLMQRRWASRSGASDVTIPSGKGARTMSLLSRTPKTHV